MKKNILYVLCAAAFLTSCSSAYRSSQTPDDVYYSPAQKEYAATDARYESYTSSSDDEYLRMKAADHYRWSNLDDYDYWNDSRYYFNNYYTPYSGLSLYTGWDYGFYNPYTTFWGNPWSSTYYPYYTVLYYKNPTVYYNLSPNRYRLSTYSNHNYNNYNLPLQNGRNTYNNSGAVIRRNSDFNVNQNRNNINSNPVRLFNNNTNNSNNFNSGSRGNISSGGERVRPPHGK